MAERSRAAAGGLVFAATSIVALALMPPPPAADASISTVRHYLTAHGAAVRTASALSTFGALGFLALLSALRQRLSRSASDMLFGAGVVTAAVSIVGGVLQAGLALAAHRIGDDALLAWFGVERMVFYVAPALGTAGVAAAAAVAFRSELPRWLASGSLVLAVVAAVGGFATTVSDAKAVGGIGLVGFLMTIVWVLSTSVVLLGEHAPAPNMA